RNKCKQSLIVRSFPSRVFTAVVLLAATAANAQEHNGTAYPFIPRFGGICNFKPDIADATFVASVSFEFFRDYNNGDKNPLPLRPRYSRQESCERENRHGVHRG
ncbi:hypothetical protein B0H11DRAFT_2200486, partial [Mycena galericulata]